MFYEDDTGQLTYSQISMDVRNQVVQSNTMIRGRQDLSLTEAKLIRIIMMQIIGNDLEFKPYSLSPGELAKLVGNSDSVNMYHNAKAICDGIMKKQLEIVSDDGSWIKYQWVSQCEYNARTKKILIMLNDKLAPFLLGLVQKGYYTQYSLDNTLQMNSIYALRVFELIQESLKTKLLPLDGTRITLNKQTIIDACMLYKTDRRGELVLDGNKKPMEKYSSVSMLRQRIIKIACDEISDKTEYYIPYESDDPEKCVKPVKQGREVVGFDFYINTHVHEDVLKQKKATRTIGVVPINN